MIRSDSFDTLLFANLKRRVEAQTNANRRIGAAARLVSQFIARATAAFKDWRQTARSRRELATLDEYQLRDIGLSRSQAAFESGKVFLQR
jgi:uncharacterized protein YjiS (DUF1127 family)